MSQKFPKENFKTIWENMKKNWRYGNALKNQRKVDLFARKEKP